MAARASWKGHLKLSLVSCPVKLYTATSSSGRIAFKLLHKETHNRIKMQPHDPELGPVERGDLVKGCEYEKDRYVVLTDEDLAKIQVESNKAIVIEQFVDESEVDGLYLDTPYYLAPDGPVAEETFRVIRDAMRQKKKVALSRLVLSSRERLIAISVRDKGLLITTLRTAEEVRDHGPYFEDITDDQSETEMLDLAAQLIDQKSATFDASTFKDNYQQALMELIKGKLKGEDPVFAKAPERGKVINLMDALKRSLEDSKKPAAASKTRGTAKRTASKKKASRSA